MYTVYQMYCFQHILYFIKKSLHFCMVVRTQNWMFAIHSFDIINNMYLRVIARRQVLYTYKEHEDRLINPVKKRK